MERLRQALHDEGYAGKRANTDRYECPACGAKGDGHGLRVTHNPNAVGKRKILLLCDANRCPVDEILQPLGLDIAAICAADDVDDMADEREASESPVPGDGGPAFTDGALVEAVANERLRGAYVWAKGLGWLCWDKKRWKAFTDKQVREQIRKWAIQKYKDTQQRAAEALSTGATEAVYPLEQTARSWRSVCSKHRLTGITDLAIGVLGCDAADFDQQPDLLNCPNGVVDLRTGKLRPHDPDLLFTKVAGIDYDPEATHSDLDKALEALPPDVAEYMQVRFGQAVTGHLAPDGILPFLQGGGANGKTTIAEGVRHALGDFYTLVSDRVILARPGQHPTELMELRGARFALIEETPEAGKVDVQRLKKLADTPQIEARHTHQNSVTFDATHSFVRDHQLPTDHRTNRLGHMATPCSRTVSVQVRQARCCPLRAA
jgi:hypothetical protein